MRLSWPKIRWLIGNLVQLALLLFAIYWLLYTYSVYGTASPMFGIWLLLGSPIALALTFFAWMLAGYGKGSRLANGLAMAVVAVVGLNWAYYLTVWKSGPGAP